MILRERINVLSYNEIEKLYEESFESDTRIQEVR